MFSIGPYKLQITLEEFAAAIDLMIFIATIIGDRDKKKKSNIYFMNLLLFNALMLFADVATWICLEHSYTGLIFKIIWVADYGLLMADIMSFHGYFCTSTKGRITFTRNQSAIFIPYYIMAIAFWTSSFWTGWLYRFDSSVKFGFVYEDFYWVAEVIALIPVLMDFYFLFSRGKSIPNREKLAWVSYGVLPIIVAPLQTQFSSVITYCAISLSVILIYSMTIVEKEKDEAELELALNESQARIIKSQIQPHFLYNSLASISQLCRKNPKQAEIAIDRFSDYLRVNMDSLKGPRLVSFEQEMEHIDTYIWLEQMRFGNRLNFEKEIEVYDFMIPNLTIQPLVENAVKHGISPKKEGGTVRLITRDVGSSYQIIVEDDGVGFDPQFINGQGTLAGLDTVREKLKNNKFAKADFKSQLGEGTCITILINKEWANENNSRR